MAAAFIRDENLLKSVKLEAQDEAMILRLILVSGVSKRYLPIANIKIYIKLKYIC